MLPAGRVGRHHGLDGFFHVTHPQVALLAVGTPVTVGEHETEIAARKGSDDKPLIRLAVASTKEAVEALRGTELLVAPEHAPARGEDEFLASELEGCAVRDGDRTLGVVERMLPLPSCEALELDTGLLVPLVRDAIREIDVERKTIEIDAEFLGAA
jgi:16S rRNA processing protein RimM